MGTQLDEPAVDRQCNDEYCGSTFFGQPAFGFYFRRIRPIADLKPIRRTSRLPVIDLTGNSRLPDIAAKETAECAAGLHRGLDSRHCSVSPDNSRQLPTTPDNARRHPMSPIAGAAADCIRFPATGTPVRDFISAARPT